MSNLYAFASDKSTSSVQAIQNSNIWQTCSKLYLFFLFSKKRLEVCKVGVYLGASEGLKSILAPLKCAHPKTL
jgi:hypothetical protein